MSWKYDPEVMTSEAGMRLYDKWLRIHTLDCCPEFMDFEFFYDWAIKSGFTPNKYLMRTDKNLPFSPDNCYWMEYKYRNIGKQGKQERAVIAKWNRTVNSIRKAYGMKPLEDRTEDEDIGCT